MEGRQQAFQVGGDVLSRFFCNRSCAPYPALTAIDGATVVDPLEDLDAKVWMVGVAAMHVAIFG